MFWLQLKQAFANPTRDNLIIVNKLELNHQDPFNSKGYQLTNIHHGFLQISGNHDRNRRILFSKSLREVCFFMLYFYYSYNPFCINNVG